MSTEALAAIDDVITFIDNHYAETHCPAARSMVGKLLDYKMSVTPAEEVAEND